MKYGYARVSTHDQNPELQLTALKKAGCRTIYVDKATGAHTKRPELAKCLKVLKKGDTLIVWKLDRLGRSLRDLIRPYTNIAVTRGKVAAYERPSSLTNRVPFNGVAVNDTKSMIGISQSTCQIAYTLGGSDQL